MDVQTLLRLDAELNDFIEDIFVSLRRKGWQQRCSCYMTGLMLDGQRKSVQPMAARLDEPNEQSLQHFLANTPWDPVPVRQRLAVRMHQVIGPSAWVFDDTGFVKDGRMSPCVARQYTGTAGKITNCQVATTLHLATDQESCPINWRLFMPESWARPGPLRRPQMGRLAPPRHPRRRRPRVPHLATPPPKSSSAGMTLYGVIRHIQAYLARIIGTCPTCDTKFPDHYPRDG